MAKFTIEISDKDILEAFDNAAAEFDATPTDKKVTPSFKKAIQADLENHIAGDLETFFQEGMNADMYWDFLSQDSLDE